MAKQRRVATDTEITAQTAANLTTPAGPLPPSTCGNTRLPLPRKFAYSLRGPQIEPEASFWTRCRVPCVITIAELTKITDFPTLGVRPNPCCFPDYPSDADTEPEIEELLELASLRDDPGAVVSSEPGRERLAISPFLQMRPQPLGAVYNQERDTAGPVDQPEREWLRGLRPDAYGASYSLINVPAVPVIRTGRELARYFESETPGLAHRHALNILIRDQNWSPPRQAWVWAALDITIYSALLAAWYAPSPGLSIWPRHVWGCGQ